MSSLVKRLCVFLCLLFVVFLSSYIGYRCGLKSAPQVRCSVQLEHELLSNPAFRSYVSRQYGRAFQKEIDQFLMSPTMESIVLDWLRTEAPLCRNPVVGGVKHAPKPSVQDFNNLFTRPVKK